LLLTNKADVNATNSLGQTPLAAAAEKGLVKIAALILSHGAEVNATNTQAWHLGWTPLHDAVYARHKDMAALLLTNHADPNARIETLTLDNRVPRNFGLSASTKGYTPLLIAINESDADIVESLLAFKADPSLKSENGEMPIFKVLYLDSPDARKRILTSLIEHGAKPDTRDANGFTPLMIAAERRVKESVGLLLAHLADVNAQDADGRSVLNHAIYAGGDETEIPELLLAAGADPNLSGGFACR
jgi:cytohesin